MGLTIVHGHGQRWAAEGRRKFDIILPFLMDYLVKMFRIMIKHRNRGGILSSRGFRGFFTIWGIL